MVDSGQPFYLRALAQWLRLYKDPDVQWLMDEQDSFATGVHIGFEQPLPRSPQVFPEKGKHRKMDETEFCPIADNYPSAQISTGELEKKFREEELLGRMHPFKTWSAPAGVWGQVAYRINGSNFETRWISATVTWTQRTL